MPTLIELLPSTVIAGFFWAFVFSGLIVATQKWHGRLTHDQTHGVQRMHTHATPRIGGLAIYLAVLCVYLQNPDALGAELTALLLSVGVIVFSFGLIEDMTQKVSVAVRMWVSLLPGLFIYFLTNQYLSNLDFAVLNQLLAWVPLGILFTAFALSGMTHAINFLDGLNGLAAMSALWIIAGLATLAYASGLQAEWMVCLALAGAILGFGVWNWPRGKLFLGDGGAYFIGLSLGWLAVSISVSAPSVSAWAMLLLCAYPITETLYSMLRRTRAKLSSGSPDRAHLHQLIASVVVYPRLLHRSPVLRNSMSGLLASLMSVPAVMAALTLYANPWACIAAYLVYAIFYHLLYQALSTRMQRQQAQLRQSSNTMARQVGGGS